MRRSNLPIALVVSLSLLIGIVFSYVVFPMLPEHLRGADPDALNVMATNMSQGKGLLDESESGDIYWDPLYPVFIATIYEVFGPHLWVLQLSNILFHVATIVVLYAIVSRLYPGRKLVPLAAAAAFAFYPHAIWHLPRVQLAALNTFLIACFILSLLSLFEIPGWKRGAISGLLLGLSTLTRGVSLFFPLALLPVLLMVAWRRKRLALVSWLALVFAMLLVMTPSIIRNYDITHRFQPVSLRGGKMFLRGNFSIHYDPSFIPVIQMGEIDQMSAREEREWREEVEKENGEKMTDVEWLLFNQKEAIRSVVEEPVAFLRKVIWQVPRFWVLSYSHTKMTLFKIFQSVVLPLAIIGVVYSMRNRARVLLVLTFVLYYMGMHVSILAIAEHSLPVMPYVLMFAVYGLANLGQRATRLRAGLTGLKSVARGLR